MSLVTGIALSSAGAPLSMKCSQEQSGASNPGDALPSLAEQVAHGSLWSFGGQIITFSTRFGAAAHACGDNVEEASVIWTALVIGLFPTTLIALLFAAMAGLLVEHGLHLPPHLQATGTTALQLAALGFIARCAAGVFNTPQLTRLRLKLNAAINTVCNALQIALVPVALLVRCDVVVAVAVIAGLNLLAALSQAHYARLLPPELRRPRLQVELLKPHARFGGALVVSSLAALVIVNAEKALLTRFAGVTALAHYSVAATLAGLLGIAPLALTQALVPAFARLQTRVEQRDLQSLYTQALRGSLLWVPPITWMLCICAKPFLTVWAGAEAPTGWTSRSSCKAIIPNSQSRSVAVRGSARTLL